MAVVHEKSGSQVDPHILFEGHLLNLNIDVVCEEPLKKDGRQLLAIALKKKVALICP